MYIKISHAHCVQHKMFYMFMNLRFKLTHYDVDDEDDHDDESGCMNKVTFPPLKILADYFIVVFCTAIVFWNM